MEESERIIRIPPKTSLLDEGDIAENIYIIRQGCLRLWFNDNGKDITFQFFFEGEMVASFDSLHFATPSLFTLESIESSEVEVIAKERFYEMIEKDAALRKKYENKLIERFPPTNSFSCHE